MGWFFISILVPTLAPMVLVMLYWLAPVAASNQTKLIMQVKDGQLSWAAFGFNASALYEIAEAVNPLPKTIGNWAQGAITVMLVMCALIAVFSVIHPTAAPAPAGTKWYRHFLMMTASLALLVVAAISYALVHFKVT